jgi:XTP/dITP diphosphohydrolase
MRLLFASSNLNKTKEVRAILSDLAIDVFFPLDLAKDNPLFSDLAQFEVVETGGDYFENSLLKAKAFAKKTNLPSAADDTGIEVEALDNFPGVKSKRWLESSDEKRNLALLEKLKNKTNRSARFVTVICLYFPRDNSHRFFKGEIKGEIAFKPEGSEGFGYDSIFIPQGYKQTLAQLGLVKKNELSHRKIALEKLKQYLVKFLSEHED